jgi:hypothetical protein
MLFKQTLSAAYPGPAGREASFLLCSGQSPTFILLACAMTYHTFSQHDSWQGMGSLAAEQGLTHSMSGELPGT